MRSDDLSLQDTSNRFCSSQQLASKLEGFSVPLVLRIKVSGILLQESD